MAGEAARRRRALGLLAALTLFAVAGPAADAAADRATTDPVGLGAASPARPGSPLAAFPNTTVSYYTVSGANAREVRAALNARGPFEKAGGRRFDARSDWFISWRWPGGPGGTCGVNRAQARFSAKVILPRLKTDNVRLEAAWAKYERALEVHEAGHLRIAHERLDEVQSAVRASTCAGANAAGHRVLDVIRAEQIAYDRQTRHGGSQGAVFP